LPTNGKAPNAKIAFGDSFVRMCIETYQWIHVIMHTYHYIMFFFS
jgi:hypothetical protein